MAVNIFCHAYWRQVKRGVRTFESIPKESDREGVKILAKTDVENGIITPEEYEALIGEPHTPINQDEQ